ncbi:uncharacterized protein LOC131842705 [Achroia grisella]|uniref:uncharacterized protein LOC131842705 n=1 Tax=Achroia grisella TaxID=688607 RepID=UPI0027D34E5C|nr:uncharacterized protein LOC131842705 [Achroia grisella]
MINILSYVGMGLQSEVCLWTLLGLVRTIFDATLFKVNANLKQVWQMRMPEELTLPVQRALRIMISGVMLVQCFTVYIYLASYIVLLYPVFLEERPVLVLLWLLIAAVRKLLCELMSLALGLGTCVLLGPARPLCIKFVVTKVASIMPAFYMWILVYSYYHALKMASAFKTFPAVLQSSDHDYGLELAIRRRCTKSLFGEEHLRRKLVTNFYDDRHSSNRDTNWTKCDYLSRLNEATDCAIENNSIEYDTLQPDTSNRLIPDAGFYEDLFGSEVTIPRDSDRILEQFGVMLLHVAAFLKKEEDPSSIHPFNSQSFMIIPKFDNIDCTNIPAEDTEATSLGGTTSKRTTSYLQQYPQIFMKKLSEIPLTLQSEYTKRTHTQSRKGDDNNNVIKSHKHTLTIESNQTTIVDIKKVVSRKKIDVPNRLKKSNMQKTLSENSVVFSNNSGDKNSSNMDSKWKLKDEISRQSMDKQLVSTDSLYIVLNSMKAEIPTNTNCSVEELKVRYDYGTINDFSSIHNIHEYSISNTSESLMLSQNSENSTSTKKSLKELNEDAIEH